MIKFISRLAFFLFLVFAFFSFSSNESIEDYGEFESKKGEPVSVFDQSTWTVQSDMVRALENDCYEINVRAYHHY